MILYYFPFFLNENLIWSMLIISFIYLYIDDNKNWNNNKFHFISSLLKVKISWRKTNELYY